MSPPLTPYEEIARTIDHALLAPTLTDAELEEGCRRARRYEVASVCTMPYFLRRCAELLAGSRVRPSTTIGFPHGAHTTAIKVAEAARALEDGGLELDMVVNVGKVRSGDWLYVRSEIAALLDVTRAGGARLKVIFETGFLDEAQKVQLCQICGLLGVDWVKTSTGFGPTGATDEDLRLMRRHSPRHVEVKAAGGVRTYERLLEVRAIGATRVGTSATFSILDAYRREHGLADVGDGGAAPAGGSY
jgi:deoxyribose-phosphate aldolase